MSNKTQLQQNNIDLQSILSTVDGLPTADSVKHGLYVWKKCNPKSIAESDYTTVDVTKGGMTEQVYLYCADSYTVDMDSKTFTLVNPTSINCMYYYTQQGNSSYSPVQLKGKYFFPNVDGTKAMSGTELYYGSPTSINASVRTDGSDSGYYTTCNAKKLKVSDVSFIEFVIADNANAYPNGGMQGGYWYEKVMETDFGFEKVSFSKVTPTSDTYSISFSHDLGEIPKKVFVYTTNEEWTSVNNIHTIIGVFPGNKTYQSAGFESGSNYKNSPFKESSDSTSYAYRRMTATSAKITCESSGSNYGCFLGGVEHICIAMA